MSQDEVKKYLDKGLGGVPLVNPDEQHKYMGTFRERCFLTITVAQMSKKANQQALIKEHQKNSDSKLLLNGKICEQLQTTYIQLATKNQINFTIINDFVSTEPDSFGVILTADKAVNEAVIDVEKKYPPQTTVEQPERKGFWNNLFH